MVTSSFSALASSSHLRLLSPIGNDAIFSSLWADWLGLPEGPFASSEMYEIGRTIHHLLQTSPQPSCRPVEAREEVLDGTSASTLPRRHNGSSALDHPRGAERSPVSVSSSCNAGMLRAPRQPTSSLLIELFHLC